jgi:hypothetical protein
MPSGRSRFTTAGPAGFERVIDPVHFEDDVGFGSKARIATVPTPEPIGADELLRPLLEYERVVGGRW